MSIAYTHGGAVMLAALTLFSTNLLADGRDDHSQHRHHSQSALRTQLGPRPFYLVNDMADSKLYE